MAQKFQNNRRQETRKRLSRSKGATDGSKIDESEPVIFEDILDAQRDFSIEVVKIIAKSVTEEIHNKIMELCNVAKETVVYIKLVNHTINENRLKIHNTEMVRELFISQIKNLEGSQKGDSVTLP